MARARQAVTTDPPVPPGVDPATPSPARLYDYYLGGTVNYASDRKVAERLRELIPELADTAWANRAFHQRAARWMAAERGVRQFIDVGSGLPTQGNTHEIVLPAAPGARVVYVDNDPIVLAYAGGFLAGAGATTMIQADLRDPDSVLGHRSLRALIDLTEPVGLLMTAVLHFVADHEDPWLTVRRYAGALASGSYVAISQVTGDSKPPLALAVCRDIYARSSQEIYPRTRADVARFFDGTELVPPWPGAPPAVVHVGEWGADDPALADSDGSRWMYCGVARVTDGGAERRADGTEEPT
ncbi:MAG TPA: SAM-dependent methyltransferase [Streptosporangiaceae bacterium]|nr:SAM-dependent methyltransferase [Streptosporangiaceae bacterium]